MENGRIEKISAGINSAFKDREGIVAVILIGSFARGEELWIAQDGRREYLSDMEFMVVLEENLNEIGNRKSEIKKEIIESLKAEMGEIDISICFTTRRHLSLSKPRIFILEFKKFGKVLYGDPKVLDLIPECTAQDCSRLDAVVLLCNRIVEQLEVYKTILNVGEGLAPSRINQYELDKGYIQLVNSLLAFEKRYCSLYPEKRAVFAEILGDTDSPIFKLDLNMEAFTAAFDHVENKELPLLDGTEALLQWQTLKVEFQKVLIYELSEILGYQDVTRDQAVKYLLSVPDLLACARGWAKVFACKLTSVFFVNEILKRLWHTSPQFLIYQQAAEQYFAEEPDMGEITRVIDKWERVVK